MKTTSGRFADTIVLLATTASLLFAAHNLHAAQDVPYNVITNLPPMPTNGVTYFPPQYPAAPGTLNTPPSPAPTVSFEGLPDDNTKFPPDTYGAVGLNHVMTMLNTQVRIQNRSGTTLSTTSLSGWWGLGSNDVFDPRVLYDPYNNRWIAVAVANAFSTSSAVFLAVSSTSDPTGTWHKWALDPDSSNVAWADYPCVGFDKDRIVIQMNMFNVTGGAFYRSHIFSINKASAYAGSIGSPVLFSLNGFGATQVPAVTYDPNLAVTYLVQAGASNDANGNGHLLVYRLEKQSGVETLVQPAVSAANTGWAFAPASNSAPQKDTSVGIMNNDARIQSVAYRNGSLWCAHTIFLPAASPNRSAIQWWELSPGSVVQQVGRIDDLAAQQFYAFPSLAVNRFNDVMIGYSMFSGTTYASGGYSLHAFNDAPGTSRTPHVFKAGAAAYYKTGANGRNRWGDYSATWPDPVDDKHFWTVQEYAAANVGSITLNGSGRWGTWWAKMEVALPANDAFTSSQTISGMSGQITGSNLRALKETGEPNHAGNVGGASVWYSWTAPANGTVVLDTVGSTFDTVLAVYSGSTVVGLTVRGSDDDSGGLGTSKLTFSASQGTVYRIAADGKNGASGAVTLNWVQPTVPVFTSQPQNKGAIAGTSVTLTSLAQATPAPSYQWKLNGNNISGATAASYTIANVQASHAGTYTAVASNSAGATTSQSAVLTVYSSAAPTFSGQLYSAGQFQMTVTGVPSFQYSIQSSSDLASWQTVHQGFSPFTYAYQVQSGVNYRFFRAIYTP